MINLKELETFVDLHDRLNEHLKHIHNDILSVHFPEKFQGEFDWVSDVDFLNGKSISYQSSNSYGEDYWQSIPIDYIFIPEEELVEQIIKMRQEDEEAREEAKRNTTNT